MKKASRIKLYVILLPVLVAAGYALVLFGRWYQDNRMQAFRKTAIIRIESDTNTETFLTQVDSLLQPFDMASVQRTLEEEQSSHSLVPGSYLAEDTFTARYFARLVTRGWQTPVDLVISGRMRSKEDIAGKIASQMMVDSLDMLNALKDSSLLKEVGISPDRLLEMILPDTYQMYWSATPDKILKRLAAEYEAFWTPERKAAASEVGLTPHQVVVLASIVAEESSKSDEYPKIASVYLTRLRKGMLLQACPTICYIYDYKIKRVLSRYLETDSPYNTYKYPGLPPTAISVPGKDVIDAVLHPDPANYLYFCADYRLNGRNIFSKTYAEHMANAALYHEAISKLSVQEEITEENE